MKRRALLRELMKIADSKHLKLEFGRHKDIPEQTALSTLKKARNV
jgi:hypothetical protein